jgi:hypothetical protein
MFGGNGGMPRFTIGNPKYLGSPSGSNPPFPKFDGYRTKKLFTFLGISTCTLTSSVPLGIYGLDLIPQQYGLVLLQMELQ